MNIIDRAFASTGAGSGIGAALARETTNNGAPYHRRGWRAGPPGNTDTTPQGRAHRTQEQPDAVPPTTRHHALIPWKIDDASHRFGPVRRNE